MKELSPRARAVLDAARGGDDPSAEDRERVRRAVLASVGGAAVGSASASAAAASAASSAATGSTAGAAAGGAAATGAAGATASASAGLGSSILAKVLVATVAVGTVAGTATVVSFEDGEPSSADFAGAEVATVSVDDDRATARAQPPAVEEATPPGPTEIDPPVEPAVEPAPVRTPPVGRRARVVPALEPAPDPAPRGPSLGDEVAVLRAAQRARGRGEPTEALRLLDEHARRFPEGALVAERRAARVLTLCDLGRVVPARAAADRFLAAHPSSPLAPRVAAACR